MAGSERAEKRGGFLKSLLILVLFAWVLRSLIIAPFSIPSGSMLPRLFIGDYLLVAKWPYGYSRASFLFGVPPIKGRLFSNLPKRGDVVVFEGPEGSDVIKRVIGLPGDTVATSGGMLVLNGRPVPRVQVRDFAMPISPNSPCRVVPPANQRILPSSEGESCVFAVYRETLPGGRAYEVIDQIESPIVDDFGPVTVPAGTIFLMGDNRDDSADSRIPPALGGMGFVPVDALVGRALVSFWSTDGSAEWLQPWTWFTALRPERMGKTFS
ncbi:signal peptidase I [Sphingomonas sp. GCM10030256]|uniref:signal peptidase I n=1 Tax=Sphingomonas sp. GCM10030256 TaxID=3273427 RepID=UPI00361B60D8